MRMMVKKQFEHSIYDNRHKWVTPLSPIGLALISYAFFIISTLIPPGIYKSIMQEPDRMFMDLPSYAFVSGCVISFCLGAVLLSKIRIGFAGTNYERALQRIHIILPLLVAAALNLVSVMIFLKNNPLLLTAWFVDAAEVKHDFDSTGGLSEALPLLFGVCWWGLWRLLEREKITNKRDWLTRFVLTGCFLFAIFTAIIKVARYDLMPIVFGFLLVYFIFKFKDIHLSLRKYLMPLLYGGVVMMGIFIVFSWLRGNNESSALMESIIGYTAASYNRLASVLDGHLIFPYGGTGTYGFRFIGHVPLLSRWIDFSQMFGMPLSEDAWASEFVAVARAGLDQRYIWASAFGYLYSDMGMLSLLYMFVVGAVSMRLWKNLMRGSPVGVVLYPWFAFSILFWFGSNYLVYPRLLTLVAVSILLAGYEKIARGNFRITMSRTASGYR